MSHFARLPLHTRFNVGDSRHCLYEQALQDLMSRGVPMKDAHRALRQAICGSHATCSTVRNGRRTDVVEVTYFKTR